MLQHQNVEVCVSQVAQVLIGSMNLSEFDITNFLTTVENDVRSLLVKRHTMHKMYLLIICWKRVALRVFHFL